MPLVVRARKHIFPIDFANLWLCCRCLLHIFPRQGLARGLRSCVLGLLSLAGWLAGWLVGWLADWLLVQLIGWLLGWLDGWLVGWLAGLAGWLGAGLVGWLTGWPIGWLIVLVSA